MNAGLLIDARAELAEGALWDPETEALWWVDIDGCRLHRFDPATGDRKSWHTSRKVGTVVRRASGGVVLALEDGFQAFDPGTGKWTPIVDPEPHHPGNRFNDGKCDPAGRFWAGTMSLQGEPNAGTLWRLDPDHSVTAMIHGVSTSNGLVWSSDHTTFYYIDTPTREVAAYNYDIETGEISNRRVAITVPASEGYPDGMAIDTEDRLWIAHWGGGQVVRWDPQTGRALERVFADAPHTTSCAFGGPDLDTLYITTARAGMRAEHLERTPHAGGVFSARPGVKGVAATPFAG